MNPAQTILFRAKPSLRRVYFFAILYAALITLGRYGTDLDPRFNPVWWIFFFVCMLFLFYNYVQRCMTTYTITNEDIRVREGVLTRRLTIVPYRRVTNISLYQNVINRLFGLVDVLIDTAGGDLTEVIFYRINGEDARRAAAILRDILDEHGEKGGKEAGLEDFET